MSKNLRNQVYLVVNSLSINNITINAPQNITYTWTLPNTIGSSGQFLTTDGTGVLSWTSTPVVSGTLTVGGLIDNSLTASQAVFTNASKKLVSVGTTGSGNVVLATAPTISGTATFTSTVETIPPITVSNNAVNFTNHVGDFYAPNTGAAGQVYSRHGVNSSSGNRVQNSFFYLSNNSSSNYMTYTVNGTNSFRINNSNSAPFTFINPSGPVAFGAGGISVSGGPLPTAFGGTGTASIGTPGQYAIVNAGGTGYSFTTGPGGGGVTSVGLAGDSTFNGIFTITTSSSNPITNSGILTINVTNFTGTGNLVLATSPTLTTPNIGVATGTSLNISGQFTSTVASGTPPLVVSSTTNVPNLNASSLNGATFASPGTIGSTTPSTIAATTISASGAITSTVATSNPPFVVASTTNVPNLNASSLNGATFASPGAIGSTTPSTIAATSITATGTVEATLNGGGFTTPLAAYNATGSTTLFQLGRTRDSTGNIGQFSFVYNGNNDATNTIGIGFYGGGGSSLSMLNSTTTGATFNCKLTATTINSTSLTASKAVFTDASKNLVSVDTNGTGNIVLTTSPTLTTPNIGVATATSLNASGTVTAATLNATGFTASQAVFTDGSKNLISVANTGSGNNVLETSPTLITPNIGVATSTSIISSSQCWGASFQATSNSMLGGGNTTVLADLTTVLGPFGPDKLISSATGWQNTTGKTLSVLFTYSVFWDPALGGGVVQAALRKNASQNYGGSAAGVFSTTYNCSCTGSAIISLVNGDYVEIWLKNNLGGSLSYKGGAQGGETTSHVTYHILN